MIGKALGHYQITSQLGKGGGTSGSRSMRHRGRQSDVVDRDHKRFK